MSDERDLRITFRGVEVFIAAVEEGSITGAAKRLGASPSSVSLQLSNLEAVLDTRLIERSAHRFTLTAAGETFRPRAMRILDEVSGAQAALSASNQSPRMIIRIAIVEDFDAHVVPNWLAALGRDFPNVRFQIKSGASHENHSALISREVDMIVAVDATEPADWVEEHAILRDPYVLVSSGVDPTDMTALMQRPFIRYAREQFMGRQIEAQFRRTGTVPPRGDEFSSSQAVLSMVRARSGWAVTTAAVMAGTPQGEDLTVSALPIPAFARTLSLYARRDVLGDLPARFAGALRGSVGKQVVAPSCARLPFLAGALRILRPHEID